MDPLRIFVGSTYDVCLEYLLKQPDSKPVSLISLYLKQDENGKDCTILLCGRNQDLVISRILGNRSSLVESTDPRAWKHMVKFSGGFKELYGILFANFNQIDFG